MITLRGMQARLPSLFAILACTALAGCFFDGHSGPPPDTCPAGASFVVDTGASLSYGPGVDAGYYVSYGAGGHWHIEWTCDTHLSAEGCNFTGAITVTPPRGGVAASCFQCEPSDEVSVTPDGPHTIVEFDTLTTTGIDGVDFTAEPGSSVSADLEIDGAFQPGLVFLPSEGRAQTADCDPATLVPSTP